MSDSIGTVEPRRGVVALWSAPRCRSTAFLRMMMIRTDVMALHEPFSRLADFGYVEVDGQVLRSERELLDAVRRLGEKHLVFFKDTTDFRYAGVLADEAFLREAVHTFIIRRPEEAIASHFALNRELQRDEVGFAYLHELYQAVAAAQSDAPLVLDAADLVTHSEAAVRAYCDRVGLLFDPAALNWSPGMRMEWGLTERWHVEVSESAGFIARATAYTDTIENNAVLADYYRYHLPFFEYLRARRLVLG